MGNGVILAEATNFDQYQLILIVPVEPKIISSAPTSPVNDTAGASRTFNITTNQTVNVTWLIDNTQVSSNTNVTGANYTSTSAGAGIWNVTVIASNTNGTDSKTWLWNVSPGITSFAPPPPVNLSGSTGNFFVNHSWQAGSGNRTDSFNVSVNGAWHNGTTPYYNDSGLAAHSWSNISVYSFNSSGTGTMNAIPVSANTRVANNPVTIGNVSVSYILTAGDTLSIYPTSSDPDGDTVTFARNFTKGTFYTNNGTLFLTSSGVDTGIHSWQINVSDGYGSVSAANFTVTVTAVPPFIPPAPSGLTPSQGNFWINYTWTPGAGNVTDSYNVSVNGIWTNNTIPFRNNDPGPHGWSNISVYAYNNSGPGTLNTTPAIENTRIANNPVIIGNVSGSYTLTAGDTLSIYPTSSDPDGDTPFFARNFTNGTFNPDNGTLVWTTIASDTGIHFWQINVRDGYGSVFAANFMVKVNAVMPIIPPTPSGLTASRGNFWVNYTWTPGPGNVTDGYNVSVNDIWANDTILFSNNTVGAHGWSNISVYAYNNSGTGQLNPAPATLNKQVENNIPVLAPIGNKEITAGQLLTFTISATDADNDMLTNATNAIKGSFIVSSGVYTWTPGVNDIGTYHWEFNTRDPYGGIDNETITVIVNAVPNHVPVQQHISNKNVDENQTLRFTIITTDADGDTITFGTNASKGGLNTGTGEFTWTPTFGDAGVYVWYFNSYDGRGGVATETITVTVTNIPLTITSRSPLADTGTIQGTGQAFTVNLNRSANVTWYFNGTPAQANSSITSASYTNITAGAGVHNITSIVSDGFDIASTMWNWTVSEVSTYMPPSPVNIASTSGNFYVNTTWQAGSGNVTRGYNVSVNGAWTNGSANTFANSTLSAHAWQNVSVHAFNSSGSGNLNQTPAMRNTRIPNNYPIQAGIGSKSINENQTLSFTVSAIDADGDTITYGTNATGGNLNTTTGAFTWTPTFADAGTYIWYFNSSDSYGAVATETITVAVTNIPLSITSRSPLTDPVTIQGTGQTFIVYLNRSANVTWYFNGAPVQANNSITSASYTNITAGAGVHNITAIVSDGFETASTRWNWTVSSVATYMPPPPVNIASTTGNFYVNTTWQAGSGNVTSGYNVSVNGAWTNGSANIFANSTLSAHAWQNVSVYAFNNSGTGNLNTTPAVRNTRIPNNYPLQAGIGSKSINENHTLSFIVSATDADGDTITYSTNATRGNLNPTTGAFTWTPAFADAGTYIWYFSSSDTYGAVATETITVTVNNIPLTITSRSPLTDPRTIQGTGQAFTVNLNRSANVTWYFNRTQVQANSSITSARYTNLTAGVGVHNITAIVSDGFETVSTMWNWTVTTQAIVPDTTPPLLIVEYPVNGQIFGMNTITVSGTASDTSGIASVTVSGIPANGTTTWSRTINLTSGKNNITVVATDNAGNTASVTITVTYIPPLVADTAPPLLIVSQPVNNQDFITTSITVSGTATDASGIYSVTVNGNPVAVSSTGSFSASVLLANGSNRIVITATDASANANNITITRTVTYKPPAFADTAPPLLIVSQPVNNQDFITNSITVSGTATDASGIYSVTVNGNPVAVSSTGSFSASVLLANGSNRMVIKATDASANANNITITRTITYKPPVVADTEAPLLIVSQPANNQTFATDPITVDGAAADASGIYSVTVNGYPVAVSSTGSFTTIAYLTNGSNTIVITATDASTNANNVTITRRVTYTPPSVADTVPPLLVVSQPVNNQAFATEPITVSGAATDASGIYAVTVNGAPATISGNSFSSSLTLNAGTNFIEIEAIDSSSNYNRATVNRTVIHSPSVIEDTNPPELFVNQPVNGQDFITNSITVSGTASENNGISGTALDSIGIDSVSVNGAIIAQGAGPFSTNLYLTPGTNTITIVAADYAGNTASVTRTVNYTLPVEADTTPPLLTVFQPENGQNFATDSITVSGTAYDTSGIYSVNVNGNAVFVSYKGSFSSTVYLADGSNNITVSATDASTNANMATLTRTITYAPPVVADTAPPLIILDQPGNGQVLTTSPVTVSGKVIDDSGIHSVTVNGVPAYLTQDGRFGVSVDLNIGSNTIVVQAIDSSGNLNTNTTTLTVTRIIPPDTEPPALVVAFPTEGLVIGSLRNSIEVHGTVSDNTGVGSVMVNGVPATLVDGSFIAPVPLTTGRNFITIIATDNSTSRNSKTITRNVTYSVPATAPGPESNISLISNPPVLAANGREMANIIAHVTDANGNDVVDGTDITFISTDGRFYLNKADVGILPGKTEFITKTRNGMANILLISSTIPGTAVVSAYANNVSASLDIAFMASSRLKSKIGDITLHIVHSPVIVAYNTSIELNGGVGSVRTSTELAAGMVNGTFLSYSIGTATIEIIITNPVVSGDQTLFTVDSLLLNNSPVASDFTGIGTVKSDVDVGINTSSTLDGMKFEMSLYKGIEDELKARGGTDADVNQVISNLGSALSMRDVTNRIAFVTAAKLNGATAQDILEVPIAMSVSADWYNNTAASQLNNVLLAEISTNGSIGQIRRPVKYAYDPVNDMYTFMFRMNGFSTFALIGTIIAPPPPQPPSLITSGGAGGGAGIISPEPFSNIETFEIMDEYLEANVPASYIFNSPDHDISEVLITPSDNFGTTSVRVELLKDVSKIAGVTPPLGIVYKYYNIWVGAKQIESGESIIDAFIGFKVDKSWLAQNNLEENSVSLLGWDGSTWISLETAPKSIDEQFVYYVAKTNAFLPFAIVASSPYPAATVKAGKAPALINIPLPKIIGSKFLMWVYILIAFILIGLVIYGVRKYKKSLTVHEKAMEIMPEDADAWYNRGFDLYEQGKYDEAIKAYDKAIDIMHKKEK